MKIYILSDYERVRGAFSSHAKAEERKSLIIELWPGECLGIEECELDAIWDRQDELDEERLRRHQALVKAREFSNIPKIKKYLDQWDASADLPDKVRVLERIENLLRAMDVSF